MQRGRVEIASGFETLVFACEGRLLCARQKLRHRGAPEWLESVNGFERLVQSRHAVHAGDNNGCRKIERVVQTFDAGYSSCFWNCAAGKWFHAEHADLLLHEHWKHSLLETAEMRIKNIEWHLHGIESKTLLGSNFECAQVDRRIRWTAGSL
jgi:hypothetical protein